MLCGHDSGEKFVSLQNCVKPIVQIYVSAFSLGAACLLREIKILALIFSVFCVFLTRAV